MVLPSISERGKPPPEAASCESPLGTFSPLRPLRVFRVPCVALIREYKITFLECLVSLALRCEHLFLVICCAVSLVGVVA